MQANITITFCDVSATTTVSYPEGQSQCIAGSDTRQISAAAQNITFSFQCNLSGVSTELAKTVASNSFTVSVPQNNGDTQRTFTIGVTFADGGMVDVYIIQGVPSYRYANIPIETDYVCEDGDKYYKEKRQKSYDGGITWVDVSPAVYRTGSLYESGSSDCSEVIVTDKWIENGYTCSGYDKYIEEVHVYSNDGETFFPTYPPETRLGRLVEQNSEYCGYELKTQWRDDGDEDCYGTTLRHVLVKYVSEDMGQTWTKAVPEETKPGDIIETMSSRCGWIDWEAYKYIGVYDDDSTNPHLVDYNGSYVVTTADTKPSGEDISHLTRIIIGSAVTAISDYCFESAVNLTQTGTMPSTLKSIGYGAFAYCTSLPNSGITLNEGLQTIGTNAFNHCTSLTGMKIPSTVTNIGTGAFWGCNRITSITFVGNTPPTLPSTSFDDLPSDYVIYVPYAALSTYQVAYSWCASHIQGAINPNPNVPSM